MNQAKADFVSPELIARLRCPRCHASLTADAAKEVLVCTNSDTPHTYRVVDGIPVMLVEDESPS